MVEKDWFASYHPIVLLAYFIFVLVVTMCCFVPWISLVSFVAAFVYSVYLNGKGAVKFNFYFVLPVVIITGLLNPLFNHAGVTILFYFHDNPITLEAVAYGICAGITLGAVLIWFSCFNAIITSDKIVYLLGRFIPSVALVFSMSLGFVPHFKDELKLICEGQKGLGRTGKANVVTKLRRGMAIFSIALTEALEGALDTADSMNSRGFGQGKRTSFSHYRFNIADLLFLIFLLIAAGLLVFSLIKEVLYIEFYPMILTNRLTIEGILTVVLFAVISFLPLIIDVWRDLIWHYMTSKI